MVEATPGLKILPIFSEEVLVAHPTMARSSLAEYWEQQSNITRWHLEEFGVSHKDISRLIDGVEEILFEDALRLPDTFGKAHYRTIYLDGWTEAKGEWVAGKAQARYQKGVKNMCDRYASEQKKRFIYAFSSDESIVEICQANGGIPGYTEHEKKLLSQY
jgi:hypothetical protein